MRGAEAEARGGEDVGAVEAFLALIRHPEAEFLDMKRTLALLDERRAQTVHLLIADQFPISHSALLHASEMQPEDLDRALVRLLAGTDPAQVVRKVEAAPGKAYYKIPSVRTVDEFASAIEHIGAEPELIKVLRPLLEVAAQFFLEEGHPKLPGMIAEVLMRSGGLQNGSAADEQSTAAARLLFSARGQVVEESSVPDLLREVVRLFGRDPALQALVPFRSGGRRNFVARDAHHVAGHAFVSPLEIREVGLVFEANQSRLSVLKSLRKWFSAAQIPVERAELDGESIVDLAAVESVEGTASGSPDEELVLQVKFSTDSFRYSGRTVGTFLSAMVSQLVDEGLLTIEKLPVRIGRVRYLVAQEPKHANGRAFDSPVEAEGMYIESALTRADARFHGAMLCESLGGELVDAAVDPSAGQ